MSTTETFVVLAGKPYIEKDPNAVLDYKEDWTAWLAASADTFSTTVGPTTPAVVGVVVNSAAYVGTSVVIWVSGGVVGTTGSVTVRITTQGGRTDDRTLYFKIRNK